MGLLLYYATSANPGPCACIILLHACILNAPYDTYNTFLLWGDQVERAELVHLVDWIRSLTTSEHPGQRGKKETNIEHKTQTLIGQFLYSAVPNPQDCSKCYTFYFPDKQTLFNQTPSLLLWEPSSHMLQLMCKGCTYPPLSIARYSFIQLSELEQCRVKKPAQGFARF